MSKELLSEVDRGDRIIGYRSGEEFARGDLIFRASVIILKAPNDEFIFSKRAKDKYPFPGTWVCAVGGRVRKGESYLETAIREMEEEIKFVGGLKYVGKVFYEGPGCPCYIGVFTTIDPILIQDLTPDTREIDYLEQFTLGQMMEIVNNTPDRCASTFVEVMKMFSQHF